MKLEKMQIKNFRGIKKLDISFNWTTVLIGENNTGKTSIIDALRICLSRPLARKTQFDEYDYHLLSEDSQPIDAEPISITLYFKEESENEWPDEILQMFDSVLQVDPNDGLNTLIFQVTSSFSPEIKDFVSQAGFLDGAGNAISHFRNPRVIPNLQKVAPIFYLAALRDAAQEFRPNSRFWGPFVRSLSVDEKERQELEQMLSELNQKILDSHVAFDVIKERLKQASNLVPLADENPIQIQALPAKVFDMLSRTQVMLNAKAGAMIPLYRHGSGTQSLAVLFLFDAFLSSRLEEDYDNNSEPILALEEPEAHLHPSAIRSLGNLLHRMIGQRIITTHSGDLLASIPIHSVRRLARRNGEIKVFSLQPDTLELEEIQKVKHHIRSQRGFLLFANCWLLVEGQSEYRLMPELARIIGNEFDTYSVCCIEFSQFGKIDIILRLADDFGIPWHVLIDNDGAGREYSSAVKKYLKGRPKKDRLTILPEKNIEHFLWHRGYDYVYKQQLSKRQLKDVPVPANHEDYPAHVIKAAINKTSKPYLATAVGIEASDPTSPGVPKELEKLILTTIRLSKGES